MIQNPSSQTEILKSTDKGLTWSLLTTNLTLSGLSGIEILNDSTYMLINGVNTYLSIDYGSTWEVVNSANNNLSYVKFWDSSRGIVCGNNGGIYRTTDVGLTWENKSVPGLNYNYR